jgi:hypothetical protein
MKSLKIVTVISSVVLMTGCSTMFGNNSSIVQVNTSPKGAKISVNTVPLDDKTPADVHIRDKSASTVIKVEVPNCPPRSFVIEPKFQPVGFLNILFWPGFIVDAATGNMKAIPEDQQRINVNLCDK